MSANASKALQRLSSGERINGSGKDAAGLAVGSKMRNQIRGLHPALKNTAQGDIANIGKIDFEDDPSNFEMQIRYNHSGGVEQFTDSLRLKVINDKTDKNNLALEGLDISTRNSALEAI